MVVGVEVAELSAGVRFDLTDNLRGTGEGEVDAVELEEFGVKVRRGSLGIGSLDCEILAGMK